MQLLPTFLKQITRHHGLDNYGMKLWLYQLWYAEHESCFSIKGIIWINKSYAL